MVCPQLYCTRPTTYAWIWPDCRIWQVSVPTAECDCVHSVGPRLDSKLFVQHLRKTYVIIWKPLLEHCDPSYPEPLGLFTVHTTVSTNTHVFTDVIATSTIGLFTMHNVNHDSSCKTEFSVKNFHVTVVTLWLNNCTNLSNIMNIINILIISMCVYVYTYIYIYIYVYMYMYIYYIVCILVVWLCTTRNLYAYVPKMNHSDAPAEDARVCVSFVFTYTCTFVCISYICMYICMYTFVCIYMYMY